MRWALTSRRIVCRCAAIACEPIRMHSRTAKWTNSDYKIQDTRMAIAPYGDRRCSSHLSHRSGQMYEDKHYTASPSPQFACPQRGRKRLSREAILRTELALEWPERVQIGRCKVQWLPRTANKRILTSFCSKKIIYTTETEKCEKSYYIRQMTLFVMN